MPEHLGDGVYVRYERDFVTLSTGTHDINAATNIIYLDKETWLAFNRYCILNKVFQEKEA